MKLDLGSVAALAAGCAAATGKVPVGLAMAVGAALVFTAWIHGYVKGRRR